jgi:HD-GYP domain-containing protein (c-di-GMP phosphodiesterase class II)
VDFLKEVATIVEQHHERMDGRGYPKGLNGEEICLEARIISVVDAYDAMTSDRPYRRALSNGEAIKELERFSGTQFDPMIVDIFTQLLVEEKSA